MDNFEKLDKFIKAGDYDEALKFYDQVDKKLEDYKIKDHDEGIEISQVYNYRGLLKYFKVQFDEAILDFSKAIQLDPDFSSAYFNRGTIYYRMSDFNKAIDDFKLAQKLNPNCPEIQLALERSREQINKLNQDS